MNPRKYFEIDFPEITGKKAQTIAKSRPLSEAVGEFKIGGGGTELHGSDYHLIAGDLRQFDTSITPVLVSHGFDRTLPTVFISECVLIYIPPVDSERILRAASDMVDTGLFLVYEQIEPDDAFGQTMLQNLRGRGIELLGWERWKGLVDQRRRFHECGWDKNQAVDINSVWYAVPQTEKERIAKLEIFDEIEEWQLLSAHYCVSWGVKGGDGTLSLGGATAQS
ncbi:hypothetical protein HKX48_005338 [Thoreauomyces humboldtii]|nr:hypothetical protein HKX48_005338 [Thoreauomyces humboldtii]